MERSKANENNNSWNLLIHTTNNHVLEKETEAQSGPNHGATWQRTQMGTGLFEFAGQKRAVSVTVPAAVQGTGLKTSFHLRLQNS